jgi:hypothetical protein
MQHPIPLTRVVATCAVHIACMVVLACLALLTPRMSIAGDAVARPDADASRLDVGIVVFDPGIPADASTHSKLGIFPEIRKAEAKYMPVMLRDALNDTDAWGVVRVLPEALDSSELLVTGTLLHSDGQRLAFHIKAIDASGALWLDQTYTGTATPADYVEKVDPFLEVYTRVSADLLAARQHRSPAELVAVRQLAELRYASALAPQVFESYLARTPEGRYSLLRLPAEGDPMLDRVLRIRDQEFRFVDIVDEQYTRLGEEMASTYQLWRQYGAEQAEYRNEYQERVSSRESQGRRGSFAALEQSYNAYKWSKIHEQDLDELALGFNNEVAPTAMEVSGTVFNLSGSLDTQYAEWREILQRIFALESGLPPAP